MHIVHDERAADYGSSMRPEQPARITKSVAHLRAAHPDWHWQPPTVDVADEVLLLAHTPLHLKRLTQARDFDEDTPFLAGIGDHARRSVTAALTATELALAQRTPVFSLMRPPGHHATATQAMGFCYLNQVAIGAIAASEAAGGRRVAIWDFDAHHGNGTEAIVRGRRNLLFASVHQYPGYPDTGTTSVDNVLNWPVAPRTPRAEHMAALRTSLDSLVAFAPHLIIASAGFDAYERDPITAMTLKIEDFSTLGQWLRETNIPTAGVLEGGYSDDLPLLIDAFLSAWDK